jgi:multiple antibiotic resistance protein
MMDNWSFFVFAFSSLFTIVNPFSAATMFLTITKHDDKKKRLRMAFRASVTCAIALLLFAFAGHGILNFFGITVDAFRIAGGVLITKVGLEMIRNKERHLRTDEAKKEAMEKDDVSIVPLAIPMLSGPGAITTAIVLMQQASGGQQITLLASAIIITSTLAFFILSQSTRLAKALGQNGVNVLERIMGLLVLVIGIQFFINGAHGVLLSWGILV